MPTVSANGIAIHYELSGVGPRLLVFNGSGGSIESLRPTLTYLTKHFEVLVHDQRGLGLTEVPEPPYAMADYAADAAALLDSVAWDTCAVIGISFGGMVAQEFAATYPERVYRLALVCTSPGGSSPSFPLHELFDLPPEQRVERHLAAVDTRYTPEFLASSPLDQMLVDATRAGAAIPKTELQLVGERAQLEARRHHDVVDRLGHITCPTFVASGRYDGVAPPDNGRLIASLVPGAEFHLYEGGHVFLAQDRSAFPEITAFLGAARPG